MKNIKTEEDIIKLIKKDIWMMDILKTVRKLNLPDWWIGAGFIRSKIWDSLHGYTKRTPLSDIDVIYFDKKDFSKLESLSQTTKKEIYYENVLKKNIRANWSVTNQARMHLFHNDPPYKSSGEGLAQWIETATCIGVKLDKNDKLILTTPRGINDLINLILRPTPNTNNDLDLFKERVDKKQWLIKWPKLTTVSN